MRITSKDTIQKNRKSTTIKWVALYFIVIAGFTSVLLTLWAQSDTGIRYYCARKAESTDRLKEVFNTLDTTAKKQFGGNEDLWINRQPTSTRSYIFSEFGSFDAYSSYAKTFNNRVNENYKIEYVANIQSMIDEKEGRIKELQRLQSEYPDVYSLPSLSSSTSDKVTALRNEVSELRTRTINFSPIDNQYLLRTEFSDSELNDPMFTISNLYLKYQDETMRVTERIPTKTHKEYSELIAENTRDTYLSCLAERQTYISDEDKKRY